MTYKFTPDLVASRWLVTGGMTGTYRLEGIDLQPSLRIYGLWEQEAAYTDSLGIAEPARNFASGRASGGTKFGYPFQWDGFGIWPYVGLYGDYYFSMDDATAPVATGPLPLIQGWSARSSGGISITSSGGVSLDLGAEVGGLGSATSIWTYRGQMRVPF